MQVLGPDLLTPYDRSWRQAERFKKQKAIDSIIDMHAHLEIAGLASFILIYILFEKGRRQPAATAEDDDWCLSNPWIIWLVLNQKKSPLQGISLARRLSQNPTTGAEDSGGRRVLQFKVLIFFLVLNEVHGTRRRLHNYQWHTHMINLMSRSFLDSRQNCRALDKLLSSYRSPVFSQLS